MTPHLLEYFSLPLHASWGASTFSFIGKLVDVSRLSLDGVISSLSPSVSASASLQPVIRAGMVMGHRGSESYLLHLHL